MVTMQEVLSQFNQVGFRPSFLSRAEVAELPKILVPGERLQHVVMGWYESGLALLCTTNHRVLLVDKRSFFLTVEDIRYDMIAEVRFQHGLMDSTISLTNPNKSLDFKSWNRPKLRSLVNDVQNSIIEVKRRQEEGHVPQFAAPQAVSMPVAPSFGGQSQPSTYPLNMYQPAPLSSWPVNPYQTGKQLLRRARISRFITASQISR